MDYDKLKAYQQSLLSEAYAQVIQQNDQSIKTWMQYKDRHKKNIEALKTLAAELSVKCIVPLGKRALMKGKLTHTSEILVCIGDGYFVKYSTQQAIELCNRRIKQAEEMLEKLEKERNLFEVRQTLPLEFGAFESRDCKDVTELWDDEKLEQWRVEHRKKEREYRQILSKLKELEQKDIQSDTDLSERLDQLELEEELADELNRSEEQYKTFAGKYSQECDDDEESSDELDEGEELQDETNEEEKITSKKQEENISIEKVSLSIEKLSSDVSNSHFDNSIEERSEIVKNRKNNETTKRAAEKLESPNKINGKFEVSIIKEDDELRVLSRPVSSKKTRISFGDKSTEIPPNELVNSVCENSSRKSKSLGRRVSFAEPHFVEVNCALDKGPEDDENEIEDTDIIQINFQHSQMQPSTSKGSIDVFNSPADIYRISNKPKSILKRSLNDLYINTNLSLDNCCIEEELEEELIEADPVAKSTYNLIVKEIQERKIETPSALDEPSKKKRPVSRFKLERASIKK